MTGPGISAGPRADRQSVTFSAPWAWFLGLAILLAAPMGCDKDEAFQTWLRRHDEYESEIT